MRTIKIRLRKRVGLRVEPTQNPRDFKKHGRSWAQMTAMGVNAVGCVGFGDAWFCAGTAVVSVACGHGMDLRLRTGVRHD